MEKKRLSNLLVAIVLLLLTGTFFFVHIRNAFFPDFSFSNLLSRNAPPAEVDLAAYLPPEGITEGPIISFNFDDGYDSAFTLGVPIVEAAGFKTTQYIVISRLGQHGYMPINKVLELQKRGHEIGAHTRMHVRLTEMPLEIAYDEIAGSKQDLLGMGVVKVDTFSYPEGDFSESIKKLVVDAGYLGARITNPGLNDRATDPHSLFYLGMNSEISIETVKSKIDDAIAQKKWLILVFHKIDQDGYENVSSELLQQTVDYVKEKHVPVVTTAQGLYVMNNIPH